MKSLPGELEFHDLIQHHFDVQRLIKLPHFKKKVILKALKCLNGFRIHSINYFFKATPGDCRSVSTHKQIKKSRRDFITIAPVVKANPSPTHFIE
jgi:hypothetical protein